MAGSIVQIPSRTVETSSMRDEITDTIVYTREYADQMRETLTDGINNLNDVIGTYDPKIGSVDVNLPALDPPSFPDKPTFPPRDLDTNWPANIPTEPTYKDYGNIDFEFVAPTPPDEIDGNFSWSPDDYTSDMWAALFAKVNGDIINGGTGLTDSVHAVIVAREKETRRANQDNEYQNALDGVGSRGFDLPSGQIAALQRDIATEIISKDQDSLNNITIKDFDLATENTRFAITTGVELEKVLRSTFEEAQKRSFESAKAAKDFLVTVYNANIQAYIAQYEGVKIRLDSLKTKVDAISEYNKGITEVYLGKASVYESQIKAITEKNKGMVDARKGEVEVYSTEVQAVSTEYMALVEDLKVRLESSRLEIDTTVKESELNLQAYTDKASLTERVAEAVSNISAQAIASALGAINTSLGNTYHASGGVTEHWSHGETLNESHNFEDS